MLHKPFIRQQLRHTRKQGIVLILCVMLSITTLVALGSFGNQVRQALQQAARTLHAGDLILRSSYPFAHSTRTVVDDLRRDHSVDVAKIHEFYSVVRTLDQQRSLLAHLKIVDANYPFYGQVELDSGLQFHEQLKPGEIVVEPILLDRLNLAIGEQLHIGNTTLTIRDTVNREPDRPVQFFSFGPRIFIHQHDKEALGLIKPGSRVAYIMRLKLRDSSREQEIFQRLKTVLAEPERIETFRSAPSGIQSFFDNFLFFLNLVGILTLCLAGIGIHSTVVALGREQAHTIAILKTLGTTNRFLITHYLVLVSILGGIGTLLGLGLSALCQLLFPVLFGDLLPNQVARTLSGHAIVEGLGLGLLVVVLFAVLPLYRLRDLKPNLIFQHDNAPPARRFVYMALHVPVALLFVGMILWQLRDVTLSLQFILSMAVLIGFTTLVTLGIFRLLRTLSTVKILPLKPPKKPLDLPLKNP